MKLSYPMDHGVVRNWADLEAVWRHVFTKEGLNVNPEEHPVPEGLMRCCWRPVTSTQVLLTEPPLIMASQRAAAAEIFFEKLRSPALFVSLQVLVCSVSVWLRGHHRGY